MAKNNVFADLLQKARSQIFTKETDSTRWLRDKARNIKANPESLIRKSDETTRSIRSGIGQMYLFGYNPKFKDTLKYYDTFPLIFPFKMESNGFYGINLHYLPYIHRARLMDALTTLTNNKKYNDTTRLKISFDVLNSASKFGAFKPCVKRYLYSHVTSKFMYISPSEWNIALFLPIERFKKANKTDVWKESLAQIGNR